MAGWPYLEDLLHRECKYWMGWLDKMILRALPDICKTVLDVKKTTGGGVGRGDRKERNKGSSNARTF